MRVWVDITDASHVLFFAPIVGRFEAAGHIVTVTARRFDSADILLRRYGLGAVLLGHHRGGGLGSRAVGLVSRTAQLVGSASSGGFDVAVGGHASDFALTAWMLGVPQLTVLGDGPRRLGDALNLRLVEELAVPEVAARAAAKELAAAPGKIFSYPGFMEEYYLHDFVADAGVLHELGIDGGELVGIVRPAPPSSDADDPREAALLRIVRSLGARPGVRLVLICRDAVQRRRVAAEAGAGAVVAAGAVDAVSLIAAADFVLGEGGVMTREVAALGTPAYTTATGTPTAVEAALERDGRIRRVIAAGDIVLEKKDLRTALSQPRDPQLFVDEIMRLAERSTPRARLGRFVHGVNQNEAPPLI